MDLSNPINSVVPSAHGSVLAVLSRTTEPLSGRAVASLTDGRVGQWRANEILGELSDAGIVLREHRPPAKLHRLNRDHVAAEGITALADQWNTLLDRVKDELAQWELAPVTACMFGSAARGQGGPGSDIDILLVPSDDLAASEDIEEAWQAQADRLVAKVRSWSGNPCEVLELTLAEISAAVARDDRLANDLRRDALPLAGRDIRTILRPKVARR